MNECPRAYNEDVAPRCATRVPRSRPDRSRSDCSRSADPRWAQPVIGWFSRVADTIGPTEAAGLTASEASIAMASRAGTRAAGQNFAQWSWVPRDHRTIGRTVPPWTRSGPIGSDSSPPRTNPPPQLAEKRQGNPSNRRAKGQSITCCGRDVRSVIIAVLSPTVGPRSRVSARAGIVLPGGRRSVIGRRTGPGTVSPAVRSRPP